MSKQTLNLLTPITEEKAKKLLNLALQQHEVSLKGYSRLRIIFEIKESVVSAQVSLWSAHKPEIWVLVHQDFNGQLVSLQHSAYIDSEHKRQDLEVLGLTLALSHFCLSIDDVFPISAYFDIDEEEEQ